MKHWRFDEARKVYKAMFKPGEWSPSHSINTFTTSHFPIPTLNSFNTPQLAMFVTKAFAILLPIALAPAVQAACQQISGSGSVDFSTTISLTYTEDGVQQCSGSGGDDGSATCSSGFELDWFGSQGAIQDPLPVHLCNAGGW